MKNGNSIKDIFRQAKQRDEKLLIVYLTAGFPDFDHYISIIKQVESSGADMVELGIPFSDPIADGPTIQYSSQVALKNGVSLVRILEKLEKTAVRIPLILMTYLNPLLSMDRAMLFERLVAGRIIGLVIPDLPIEMADEWRIKAREYGIDIIMMAAPTSPDERLKKIALKSQGFIYCVSVTGTTGARERFPKDLPKFLQRVRILTDTPIVVGFGISAPGHISALKLYADGFIVGSRIVNAIRNQENFENIVVQLKDATRR